MTTAICFDLDGTVTQLTKPYDSLLDETFETCLGHADPAWTAHYTERFFEYLHAVEAEPYRRAMSDVCDDFDISADPTVLTDELLEREFAATAVDSEIRNVLTTLSNYHPLGIITNGVGRVQREKLARTDLDDLFDAVVVSYEIGAHKPDRRIFDTARNLLDADTYVMVGDDCDADIVGAREAGFETVHIRDNDSESSEDRAVGHMIESVSDLKASTGLGLRFS